MGEADVEALVAEDVLARVPADLEEARRELAATEMHLQGAEAAAAVDPTGAFTLAYDAARKAVVAHMRASGLRVRSRFGAHYQTGRYARAALTGRGVDEHVVAFVDMRAVRNDTAYEGEIVRHSDSAEALSHARAIVAVVRRDIE
ncbi:hypothetical protein BH20ACT13_BH20ACT13_05770 [soil metagenome]